MNRRYLGDALDWWKGGLLTWLRKDTFLRDIVVVPCFSDAEDWTEEDLMLYSELLGVDQTRIGTERGAPEYVDIFFDPDIGVRTGKVKKKSKYVEPERLRVTLTGNPNCVVAIYQHGTRQGTRSRIKEVVEVLRQNDREGCICSSESSTVAMLFASHHCGRIESIHDGLSRLYRRMSSERTRIWKCV